MAEFLTGTSSVAHVIVDTLDMFLVAGAARHVDFDTAIAESGTSFTTRLRIDGTILCAGFDAIQTASDGLAADRVVIGSAGQVHAFGGAAVQMSGANARIVNAGHVSGDDGIGFDGGLFSIIDNTGTVTGIDGAAISLDGSNSVQIFNAGVLRGDSGIVLVTSYATILNSGSILATDGNGVAIDAEKGIGANVIRNSGRIEAQQTAIKGGASSETVVNTGDILGDVLLGGGGDVFRGALGLLDGDISGGIGHDVISSGRGDDLIRGDAGNDTLRGDAGDDTIYGGGGNDLIRGGSGDDVLYGSFGSDRFLFTRGEGDDRIADFANGQDRIDLQAFALPGFMALAATAADRAAGLLIDLSAFGGDSVLVVGLTKAQFDAGDVFL